MDNTESNYQKPRIKKATPFAKRVHKLLAKELDQRLHNFDSNKLFYSGLARADIQCCGYHSFLLFVYVTQYEPHQRWLDYSVGLINFQSSLKGNLKLIKEDDGASYSVHQDLPPQQPKEKTDLFKFDSCLYSTPYNPMPTSGGIFDFYQNLKKWHPEIADWSDQAIHQAWYVYSRTIHNIDFIDWVDCPELSFLGFLYIKQEFPTFKFSSYYLYEVELAEYSNRKPWVFVTPNPFFFDYKFKDGH